MFEPAFNCKQVFCPRFIGRIYPTTVYTSNGPYNSRHCAQCGEPVGDRWQNPHEGFRYTSQR